MSSQRYGEELLNIHIFNAKSCMQGCPAEILFDNTWFLTYRMSISQNRHNLI